MNQLYCGIRGYDDDFRGEREVTMLGIYKAVKAAFADADRGAAGKN